MNPTEHADVEAISAYIDGEAPEWADHVAGCAECRAAADRLRAVAAAVGAPVAPPDRASREAAIAAALGGVVDLGLQGLRSTLPGGDGEGGGVLGRQHAAERARFARRRVDWRWVMPAAAAMIAVVMGASVLFSMGTRSADENTTLAGPSLESTPTAGAFDDAKAGSSAAAGAVPPADLGEVPDAATLLARARPALTAGAGGSAGTATSRPNSGPASAPVAPGTALGERSAAPSVVGTRPCEEQARAREPNLREVVYFATARRGQTPAVVLGFATGPAGSPVTLLLLAQDGCRELLRAAGP